MTAQAAETPAVQISGLNKWYGDFHVLKNINLTIASGERIVICGPSGSGKSTLIRCINRLEHHQEGTITVNGVELDDNIKRIDAIRSTVGMVFQHFNLFPHLSVLDNCTLSPIWVKKMPRREAEAVANKFLERVRIGEQAQVSRATFRRPAATGSHRPGAVHEPVDHVVRRADLGSRPRNGQGSARHHGVVG